MGDKTSDAADERPGHSTVAQREGNPNPAGRPDYRLKSITEQIGGTTVSVAEDLALLVPNAEVHLATPHLKADPKVTCTCNSVCTCVPVGGCACNAVCRCDTVAAVVARPAPAVVPPRPAPEPPSSGETYTGGSHYWRPN